MKPGPLILKCRPYVVMALCFLQGPQLPAVEFNPEEADSTGRTAHDYGGKTALIIHYHRYDGNYANWNVWVWPVGVDGGSFPFSARDDYGRYIIVTYPEVYPRIGFIVYRGDWEEKDVDIDRFVNVGSSGVAEIWLKQGRKQFDGAGLADTSAADTYRHEILAITPPETSLPDGWKRDNSLGFSPMLPVRKKQNPIASTAPDFVQAAANMVSLVATNTHLSRSDLQMAANAKYVNNEDGALMRVYGLLFKNARKCRRIYKALSGRSRALPIRKGRLLILLWGNATVEPEDYRAFVDLLAASPYASPATTQYPNNIQLPPPSPRNSNELVVVTLNMHSFQEEADDFAKLQWIAKGLAALNTDVAALNETLEGSIHAREYNGVYYNTAEIIRSYLELMTGDTYSLFTSPIGRWDNGEDLCNAILSRYPLQQTGQIKITTTDRWPAPNWKRNCLYAAIEPREDHPVDIFVSHAMGWDSADTTQQIQDIKGFMEDQQRTNAYAVVLAGDMNIWPEHEAYPQWTGGEPTLVDTFAAFGTGNWPPDEKRIDYIWIQEDSPALQQQGIRSEFLFLDNEVDGVIFPTVSDHPGFATWIPLPDSKSNSN